nr:PREDICTED: tyrosine-protein phosphatase Lar isoform X3 [Bemisia tabaci]
MVTAQGGNMVKRSRQLATTILVIILTAAAPFTHAAEGGNFSDFPFIYLTHPPEVTVSPRNQQVKEESVAAFYCAATGGPQPVIQWRKNGKRMAQTQSRYQIQDSPGMSVLRIYPVRVGRDNTSYECIAENGVGDPVSVTANLTIYPKSKVPEGYPEIKQAEPAARVVEVGNDVILKCPATGAQPLRITWLRNQIPIDISDRQHYKQVSDYPGTLKITKSLESDQAKYECVAENDIGTEISQPTQLYVKYRKVPPHFTIPPPPVVQVTLGDSINLTCVAAGSPLPLVKWRRGPAEDLSSDDNLPVGKSVLELENLKESDNYTCIAASAIGSIETTTIVKVQSLPGPPADVRVSEVTATSVVLTWKAPGPDDLQYYVIQYKQKSTNQAYSEISGVISLHYTVRGLSPYTGYEFFIVAVNSLGRGPPSAPVFVTTGETGAKPGTAPKNVQVRPLSSSTMVIQWDAPETQNGQITGYKVYYTLKPEMPMSSWDSQMVDSNELTTISELTPHAIYTIRVQAFTSVGPGPLSDPVQVKTQQGVPSQPQDLNYTDTGETSVTLSWTKPSHSEGNIISYELYWNDTYSNEKHHRRILNASALTYTLTNLYPNTLYYIWLAARSQRGEGATTPPIAVRTKEYVPGAPPQNVSGEATGPTSIRVSWEPPPVDRTGRIVYYKLQYVDSSRPDSEADTVTLNGTSFILDELKRWTDYRIWVHAGTSVGDGPASSPITVRTHEDVGITMPGAPQEVVVNAINSTTIHIRWKPPADKDLNGVIRGYQVHVQEAHESQEGVNTRNESMLFHVMNGTMLEYNVSGLQPNTSYTVQVAALTRKGDGNRSQPSTVSTPGGVPSRPSLNLKRIEHKSPDVTLELSWGKPNQTYGQLIGYRLRYGIRDSQLTEIILTETRHVINQLERGVEYEFRVSGQNERGFGQEVVKYFQTPEGPPTGPPTNLTYRFQTPDVVCIMWDAPGRAERNGQITRYDVQFKKKIDQSAVINRNTTLNKAVFSELEEGALYIVLVRAATRQGHGPWSEHLSIQTAKDMLRAPMGLKAAATSEQSVEVWWEPSVARTKVTGYQIFYTMTAVEDLDQWQQKSVGLTHSAELVSLEKYAEYAIAIAVNTSNGLGRLSEKVTVKVKPEDVPLNLRAFDVSTHSMTLSWSPPIRLNPLNYTISFDAVKEFVDSQGMTQTQIVQRREIILKPEDTSYMINELSPFTTYSVNVSAVASDKEYRPPARITVTTQMAAPQPMVQPDFNGVVNGDMIRVVLPQASEEYGPISHYYLIVVPEDPNSVNKNPDQFLTEELISGKGLRSEYERPPYIAAKWPQRTIPFTFDLGSGETFEGFVNRKLERGVRYKVFVRAVVDAPQKDKLFTSSPCSEYMALDMKGVPPGDPPRRPDPSAPGDHTQISVNLANEQPAMVWVIGPIILALLLSICLVLIFIIRRRRQPCKYPDHAAVTRPLMADSGGIMPKIAAPSDPVELRRLRFQTPAMVSHPPIPITRLAQHIDALKANDNLKFSQEYESIEPGQQFTWDHSNSDVNKPKNRYANVIAYDHSRVILTPIEGVPGSDYINANFCDGYRKNNAYVATQGPLQETFSDFWRMIWELGAATIVMMTRLEERARIKCDQYWPSRGTETYGPITVTLSDTLELATYSIRTFHVNKGVDGERREIKQLQFTAWPDHGVPDHPAPFLQFLRRVRGVNPSDAGPLVVHCSAGVGRTGCFIVIDAMIERIRHEKTVDIYGHVTCLRAQRNYMVQTEDQYIFIHDALLEAVICGTTEVPARNLHFHIQKLMHVEAGDSITGMELEFKKLSNIKCDSSRFVSASLACNKHKNRLVHILPVEGTRVCLSPIRGIEGSDYINASFIDGYRQRGAYIATQGPLLDTTEDFWRMLWEHNSPIVVMLTKLKEMGREKCHQYWPSERSVRYDNFVVEPIAEYNMPLYILREFKVTDARDGSSRTLRQFQFTDWPEQGVPKSGDGFIDFIGQVHKTKEQFGQDGPITVHCSAGVGRTGVFITLSIVLERMQYEGIIDLFQTVRILRTQRPAMVQTEEQYQFCYHAALEYLGSFDHYTN